MKVQKPSVLTQYVALQVSEQPLPKLYCNCQDVLNNVFHLTGVRIPSQGYALVFESPISAGRAQGPTWRPRTAL